MTAKDVQTRNFDLPKNFPEGDKKNAPKPSVSITGLRIEIRTWNLPICCLTCTAIAAWRQHWYDGCKNGIENLMCVYGVPVYARAVYKKGLCDIIGRTGWYRTTLWACVPGCLSRISVGTWAILAEDFHGFSQSHHENAGIVPRMCHFCSFHILSNSFILQSYRI